MKVEQTTLKNGLNTLFIDTPGSNVSSVQIWFKAGSALENKSNKGIAHFLEHMFFKGTKKYPNMQIAKTVESFGGELNAFTSFDYTCYYINSPVNHVQESLDVLLDMVSNPEFLQEDLEPERDVVFEEYRRSIDSPNQYNFFNIQKNSFPQKYSQPILGTEKTIKNFTREQLTEFRNQYYNNQNAMLIVSSDLKKKDEIEELINEYSLPNGDVSKFSQFNLSKNAKIASNNKAVNQATITFTLQSPDYTDKDSSAEDLALNCLAFGDISPLYKDLVASNSLASALGGSTMYFSKGGCHFLRLACPIENIDKLLKAFEKSLTTVLKEGFSENDITRIKNQYLSSKIYERETSESYAFALGHSFAQTGNIHSEDEFINQMRHVTKSQVSRALRNVFSRDMHINVQLPLDHEIKDFEGKFTKLRTKINTVAAKSIKAIATNKVTPSAFDTEAKCIELKKNVQLVYRKNLMTPTFVLHAYYKGGLAHENGDNNGMYNLISKNITYGYKGFPYEKLKNELEHKSSYLNGFTGKNAFGITLHGLSEHTNTLLPHFFGVLDKPSFPAKYFALEKELIHRTIHLQKEDPVKHCFRNFNRLVFNKHPYSQDMIGNEKSLKKLSRKSVQDFYQQCRTESKLVITYCGDLDESVVIEKLAPFIESLPAIKVKKKAKNKIKPINGEEKSITFDREQTHIVIGKPAYMINTEEDLYLRMFTTLLSGQSSDLFVKVRDQMGLCYTCQPLHHTALEAGYWGIYIASGHDKKDLAIEAILEILEQYRTNGVEKEEFELIKKMISGQNLINIQTNDDYANFYSIPTLHDLGFDYQHITFNKMNKLNYAKFNKFLKEFLTTEWNRVEVGR